MVIQPYSDIYISIYIYKGLGLGGVTFPSPPAVHLSGSREDYPRAYCNFFALAVQQLRQLVRPALCARALLDWQTSTTTLWQPRHPLVPCGL